MIYGPGHENSLVQQFHSNEKRAEPCGFPTERIRLARSSLGLWTLPPPPPPPRGGGAFAKITEGCGYSQGRSPACQPKARALIDA